MSCQTSMEVYSFQKFPSDIRLRVARESGKVVMRPGILINYSRL